MNCPGRHLGQNFAWFGSERPFLQDEDQSGSRPHSFPVLYHLRSGTSPEQIRRGPELVGSGETGQLERERARVKCDSLSY